MAAKRAFGWIVRLAVISAGLVGGCASSSASPKGIDAPRLVAAEPMAGGLHVSWINVEESCDTIELERRSQAADGSPIAAFALLSTLPGTADNKHDGNATGSSTYVYRLRCKKDGLYSPYSNELGGVPGDG